MSGLLVENGIVIPSAIVIAGALASLHCAGMCGPLILSVARGRRALLSYHTARFMSYTTAGFVAGSLGHSLKTKMPGWLSSVGLLALALLLIGVGLSQLRLRSLHLSSPFLANILRPLQRRIFARAQTSPLAASFAAGALSSLLPCGHLYLFLAAAASTAQAWEGGFVMALFTLSTLPILGLGLGSVQRLLSPAKRSQVAGTLLILAGLLSLGGFAFGHAPDLNDAKPEAAAERCH